MNVSARLLGMFLAWSLNCSGCKPSAREIAERAATMDAAERLRAHQSTLDRAARAAAAASALAVHDRALAVKNRVIVEHDSVGIAACKKLAADTRECMRDDTTCKAVDVDEFRACAGYMADNGLKRNPF